MAGPFLRGALHTLFVSLMCAATAVQAQAAAEPPKSPASATEAAAAQKVEVTGSADQYNPRRDDTAAKIVVTQEELARYGDTTLSDVLKRQPGITVSGGNAGRGGGEIRMRGLGAGYTQILLNGEPAPPGFTLDSLPPSQVERIEIVRAATAEFSTQAIAGTINIVLKNKGDRRPAQPEADGGGGQHLFRFGAGLPDVGQAGPHVVFAGRQPAHGCLQAGFRAQRGRHRRAGAAQTCCARPSATMTGASRH